MTEANGRELAELEQATRLLRDAITAVAPPPGLKGKVVLAVDQAATGHTQATPRSSRRLRFAFGAGALAAAAAILVLALQPGRPAGELELQAVLKLVDRDGGDRRGAEDRDRSRDRAADGRVADPAEGRLLRALVRRAGGHARQAEPHLGRHVSPRRGRTLGRHVRRRRRPHALRGAEHHCRAGDGDPRPTGPEVLRSRR